MSYLITACLRSIALLPAVSGDRMRALCLALTQLTSKKGQVVIMDS